MHVLHRVQNAFEPMRKVVKNAAPKAFNFLRREWHAMNKAHLLMNSSLEMLQICKLDQLHTLRTVDFPEPSIPNSSTLRCHMETTSTQETTSAYLNLRGQPFLCLIRQSHNTGQDLEDDVYKALIIKYAPSSVTFRLLDADAYRTLPYIWTYLSFCLDFELNDQDRQGSSREVPSRKHGQPSCPVPLHRDRDCLHNPENSARQG